MDREDQRAVLQPLLLNAKDYVTIKLLIADFTGLLRHDARGMTKIKEFSNDYKKN